MYVHMHMCVQVGAQRNQEWLLSSLELEVQGSVSHLIWALGSELQFLRSSAYFVLS